MNTSGLLQSWREALRALFTWQETRSIHDSMNFAKMNLFLKYTISEGSDESVLLHSLARAFAARMHTVSM